MSEFWKSNPKKFCDYCKVWITDNKASIAIHESGKNHKDRVKAKLDEISKKAEAKKAEDKKSQKMLEAIEKAALDAMKQDLETNPSLKNYGLSTKSDLNSAPKTAAKSVDTEKKAAKPSVKPAVENTSTKRKAEEMPESKLGKWETVKEVKKPATFKPVDLQLPGKYDKQLAAQINPVVEKDNTIDQPSTSEVKNKWIPVSDKNESEEIKEETKEETNTKPQVDESSKEGNQEIAFKANESKEEPLDDDLPKEKQISFKQKKNEKPIVFKKRKVGESIKLRERNDD